MKLDPQELRPMLVDVPWTASARIAWLLSGILSRTVLGDRTYIVCHGKPGAQGDLALTLPATPGKPWEWNAAAKQARVQFTYPAGEAITELTATADGKTLVLLVMNDDLADLVHGQGCHRGTRLRRRRNGVSAHRRQSDRLFRHRLAHGSPGADRGARSPGANRLERPRWRTGN
jgi:hypothetical protein